MTEKRCQMHCRWPSKGIAKGLQGMGPYCVKRETILGEEGRVAFARFGEMPIRHLVTVMWQRQLKPVRMVPITVSLEVL
jgi:hypothetical protein